MAVSGAGSSDAPPDVEPRRQSRISYWAVTLGKFSFVQMLVTGLGALSGILIVRHLTKEDYALFTIANSMQATMNLLADSGVSVALMAVGGKVWQDRRRMGEVVHTALKMRRKLSIIVMIIVAPILIWLLLRSGASIAYAAILTAIVAAGLSFQLGLDVYIVVPRLHSHIARLQRLDLGAAFLRLILLAAVLPFFLNAGVAVAVAALCIAAQFWFAARWAREKIEPATSMNEEDRREVVQKIRHMLPSALFYCFQGQIIVFLLAFTGSSAQVAEVGALGRLTMLLGLFTPIMNSIVLPAFSRNHDHGRLMRRYFLVLGAFALLCVGLTGAAAVFADPLLWLLGPHYAGLRPVLLLMTFNAALGILCGGMWSMNAAKGWVEYVWAEIPLRLLLQCGLAFVFDLTTTQGAIHFAIWSQLSPILVNAALTYRGLRSIALNKGSSLP